VTTDTAAQQPRPGQWKKVDDALSKGLPKTAIQELEPIIASAIKDKAYAEAIKALGKKALLESDKPEDKIVRMQAAIATTPAEMHPVLHAILAHWYWEYFRENRWRILQRTADGDLTGTDLTTWDMPRILNEIDRQFDQALKNEKELKAAPITTYDAILDKGDFEDKYRPTLFDFLAFDAINFYASGELAAVKAGDEFEITPEGPIFGTVDEFLKWQPQAADAGSPTLKAVRLFQNMLAFHKGDAGPAASLDIDLHRLRFGYNTAVGEGKNAAYAAALKRFVGTHDDHPLSAIARSLWGEVVEEDGDFVKAREIALPGAKMFPNTPGGKLCHNLIGRIEDKSSQVSTDRVWGDPQTEIRVTYRNLTKVYFRLVKADYTDRLKRGGWRLERFESTSRSSGRLSLRPQPSPSNMPFPQRRTTRNEPKS
jgi:hypothetical protein